MKKASEIIKQIKDCLYDDLFNDVYIDVHLLDNQKDRYIKAIEKTLYQLNKIAISNYKMLIHNMLMEMVE